MRPEADPRPRRHAEPVALPGGETDLDLSHSVLRAASPIHLRYMRTMGVAATAVVSLIADGRLRGLLACPRDTPIPLGADLREPLDLVGAFMSVTLASLLVRGEAAAALMCLDPAEQGWPALG
jgi:hypothetical protein